MKRSKQTLLVVAIMLAAIIGGVGYSPTPIAQPARVTVGGSDDLRAVYAGAADIAEGGRVADATCASCHGKNGISRRKGIPNIAGQRPAYLYNELVAYKQGTRKDLSMVGAVKFLSDDALVKVAAYYASLDPAQPDTRSEAKAAPAKDPLTAGKAVASGCAGCHGELGITQTPGMPSLVGLDPKYLVATMTAYKKGQRKNDMMKALMAAFSEADMKNVALFYALQKPARAKTPAAGKPAAGKAAAASCAGCHGDEGISGSPATPSLAGQDAQYFADAIQAYKDGSRKDESMKGIASALDEKTIKDLAAYYAAQQPQPPKVAKPLTTAELAQRCDRCHGVNGNSTDPRLPALAAQRADFLVSALHDYQRGIHKNSTMSAMSSTLTETDIENLAAHYARQKARAVVYVMLPSKQD